MAKNITLLGASYSDVPAVTLPQTGGGTAIFYDLEEIYPVGSLYATETSTDNPATILGFGTWTKYAPKNLIWNDAETEWTDASGVTEDVYVWKRTA